MKRPASPSGWQLQKIEKPAFESEQAFLTDECLEVGVRSDVSVFIFSGFEIYRGKREGGVMAIFRLTNFHRVIWE
jgi:hypothetical protein